MKGILLVDHDDQWEMLDLVDEKLDTIHVVGTWSEPYPLGGENYHRYFCDEFLLIVDTDADPMT